MRIQQFALCLREIRRPDISQLEKESLLMLLTDDLADIEYLTRLVSNVQLDLLEKMSGDTF